MPTLTRSDPVSIWTEDGMPVRLVWGSTRYRVTDTPTPLFDEVAHPLLTHPHQRQIGWRFQGTPDRGESRMFEVVRGSAPAEWVLLRVYD